MKKKAGLNRAQKLALPYARRHPYSILALDPRLGKSRIPIEIRESEGGNCLIVCPGYLIPNWRDEIRKWAGNGPDITMIQEGKQIYEVCDTDYVIVSYDLAKKAENFFDWADMLVIDEGHNLKSMEAQRTQFMHRCAFEYSLNRLHILTGTPIKNRVKEFYSLLALMNYNPRIADSPFLAAYPSEIDFADHFSYRQRYQIEINGRRVTIIKWTGLKNVRELKHHLKDCYIRIRAEEGDLPPVSFRPILISDTPDPQLLAEFNAHFLGEHAGSVKSQYKKEAALKKTPFTIKYTKDLLEEVSCAAVYTDHVDSCEAIAQAFGVTALTGKVNSKIRSRLAERFQRGEGQVLVATIGALKEGRPLDRASDIVLNDPPWTPGDLKQVINRIRKVGKKKPCLIHKILGSPQDDHIYDVLIEKEEVIEEAT